MDLHIAGCLVGEESDEFLDQMTEDLRIGFLVTQNGELMGDQGMVRDMYAHRSALYSHRGKTIKPHLCEKMGA
jgi:hypothetical protein